MGIQRKNNVSTTLAAAISASDVGMTVATGTGVQFPALGATDYFYATLETSQGTQEIVKVTARSGDNMTIVRAQDGSTANSFGIGARVSMQINVATITTYDPAGTGAVATTVQAKLREIVSVKDFGATGDGVTDDTAAIQLALDDGQNGAVFFPTGTYKVSSALTVRPSTHVFGSGVDSVLKTNSATANIFNINGQFVYISDLSFNSSVTRTAGFFIDILSGSSRFRLQNFYMNNGHSGICIRNTSATVTIAQGQILNSAAATGIGIKIEGGIDLTISDILMDNAVQTFAGIYVTKADDLAIDSCSIITSGNALFLQASGTVIVSIWATNTFFDNSNRGLYINAINSGTIARCLFDQCWFSSNPTQGVLIDADATGVVNGIDFNGCHVFLNQLDGIQIFDGNCTNIQIHDCAIAGNSTYGVSIGANISYVSVQDCNINNGYGVGPNVTGIYVAPGTGNNLRICNNNLSGNTTDSLVYLTSGSNNIISGNIGYSGWITYTPTVISSAGTITTLGTVVAKYQQINKTVTISLDIPITTNGTGSGFIQVTAPFIAASAAAFAGREVAISGDALSASIAVGAINILITTYTGAYPGANGYRLALSGTYNVV
jgi:hypothetical protein